MLERQQVSDSRTLAAKWTWRTFWPKGSLGRVPHCWRFTVVLGGRLERYSTAKK